MGVLFILCLVYFVVYFVLFILFIGSRTICYRVYFSEGFGLGLAGVVAPLFITLIGVDAPSFTEVPLLFLLICPPYMLFVTKLTILIRAHINSMPDSILSAPVKFAAGLFLLPYSSRSLR